MTQPRPVQTTDERLDAVVDAMEATTTNISNAIRAVDAKVTKLDAKTDERLDAVVDTMEATTTNISNAIRAVDAEVTKLDAKMDRRFDRLEQIIRKERD